MSETPNPLREWSPGKLISVGIAVYMCVKPVFNRLVLDGQLLPLAFGFAALVCFLFAVKKSNIVIAVLLMVAACSNLPTNLKNIGWNMYFVYTIEGVLDMGAACMLAFFPVVREYFQRDDT